MRAGVDSRDRYRAIAVLLLGLFLGSLLLSLFGTMGASIVLPVRRGGVLLVTPVSIFGGGGRAVGFRRDRICCCWG